MHAFKQLRRSVALAAAGATAGVLLAFGGTPAFALSQVQIYGSGASLQEQLQDNILIPNAGISPDPTFTSTTSGSGAAEFGLGNGKLNLTEDSNADKASQLDAYIALDSPPSSGELSNAVSASGSAAVTVPVAQTPLAILLALPTDVTLNSSQSIQISNDVLDELFAGKIPASSPYGANTWGAFLKAVGLTPIASGSPSVGQFLDTGSSSAKTGGYAPITLEFRKNGAGTTLNLKEYLDLVDSSTWSSFVSENSYAVSSNWPSGVTSYLPAENGNSTDANEVSAVMSTAGTVGYATLGDTVSGSFSNKPTSLTGGYQVLYAQLQDNGTSGSPIYADPLNGSSANVYTGSEVNINGGGGVGEWFPPSAWDDSWGATEASDPTVYEDAGETGDYYPLVAVAYDIAWLNYSASGLSSDYGSSPTNSGYTAQQLLEFATSSTGQSDINSNDDYAELPSGILTDAQKAAAAVDSSSE